jgi:aryl-alcohol dehydrogenase-like predicted oxidoreductase
MPRRTIDGTELEIYPLCFGGNVFGWTADESQSFALLDAYAEAGGNFVDTADEYCNWVPGGEGGESETIIGNWMEERGNREDVVVATKVGRGPGGTGLSAQTIRKAAEDSLRRLQTDYIDIYYAHADDPDVPLEETLPAFDELVKQGKVRYIAASNYSADRLAEALATADRLGISRFVALQPQYNLMDRAKYEGDLSEVCARENLACVPYFALAMGFLTGKYRPGVDVNSQRRRIARKYLDDRGLAVLAGLDKIAHARDVALGAVALAWLAAQPTVVAPVASARTTEQVDDLVAMTSVELSDTERADLAKASAA